jgi:hypothetical protein
METKCGRSFSGAGEIVAHTDAAANYLKELCAACASGDKSAARRALRGAISELEVARALFRPGLE